jgi:beta-lactam-binding protein with PASTA domain
MFRHFSMLAVSLTMSLGSLGFQGPLSPQPVAQDQCVPPEVRGQRVEAARLTLMGVSTDEVTIEVTPDVSRDVPAYVLDYRLSECSVTPLGDVRQHYVITLELGAKVPALTGLVRDDAETALTRAGLPGDPRPPDAGADWTVTGQSPAADALVPFDTPVRVDLVSPITPSPDVTTPPPSPPPVSPRRSRVIVPALEGLAVADAEARLTEAGLVLRLDPGSPRTGEVGGQDPAAGSEVARNTTVTVRLSGAAQPGGGGGDTGPGDSSITPTGSGSALAPVALAGVLLPALLLGLVLVARMLRTRRARSRPDPVQHRPPPSIHCVAHPDPAPRLEIHLAGSPTSPGVPDIRVEAHADPGRQELREVVP